MHVGDDQEKIGNGGDGEKTQCQAETTCWFTGIVYVYLKTFMPLLAQVRVKWNLLFRHCNCVNVFFIKKKGQQSFITNVYYIPQFFTTNHFLWRWKMHHWEKMGRKRFYNIKLFLLSISVKVVDQEIQPGHFPPSEVHYAGLLICWKMMIIIVNICSFFFI